MSKGRVYISGGITNVPNYHENFLNAESELKKMGYTENQIINPAYICSFLPTDFTHAEYMAVCFGLMHSCDTIYMLKNWKLSEGATRELEIAIGNGFKIMEQGD